jgi:broad specificity phosphatase PhoE
MSDFRDLTLYVIRHGECEHNVAGRAAAQNDSPLTANGRAQARSNGALLKEVAGDLSVFDFFASSLHRTCSTMELVREGAGLSSNGYRADRRLMEIDYGDHTWMTREEIDRHEQSPPPGSSWEDWNYTRPNGESWSDVHARVGRFLETLTDHAVIVTHFGPARMIRAHYLGLTPEAVASWRPPHFGIMRLSQGTEAYFGD